MITPNLTKKKTSTKCHFKPNCIIQASRFFLYGTTNSELIAHLAGVASVDSHFDGVVVCLCVFLTWVQYRK